MHDDLFKNHIVDYLQRIIYNGEKNCLISIFLGNSNIIIIIV